MKRTRAMLILFVLAATLEGKTITFGEGAVAFDMEFVTVGNPGNLPDITGSPSVVGSVGYAFDIGKFETSRGEINGANAASQVAGAGLGLTMTDMVERNVESGNGDDQPATGVSPNAIARLVNWLNTSSGYPPAYRFDTQPGDENYDVDEPLLNWSESSAGYDPANPIRNRLARFVIPNADEWYKAAYHDAQSGAFGVYFDFATGSDNAPIAVGESTEPGTAVWAQPTNNGPAPVRLAGGPSPYGTIGQTGNVSEYQEQRSIVEGETPRIPHRGGSWVGGEDADEFILSSSRSTSTTLLSRGKWNVGFRVALLPLLGDFDGDEVLSAGDIDLLTLAARGEIDNAAFDLNLDGDVNDLDRTYWVETAAMTHFGDANLNGNVEFSDYLAMSNSFNQPAGWADGDFNGNGKTDFGDFLLLSEHYGQLGVAAVPEPNCGCPMTTGFGLLVASRRRKY